MLIAVNILYSRQGRRTYLSLRQSVRISSATHQVYSSPGAACPFPTSKSGRDLKLTTQMHIVLLLLLLLLLLILLLPLLLYLLLTSQTIMGFSFLSNSLPFCSFFTLLSPQSYSHYLHIFFDVCNPSLPWSLPSFRTYRFPLYYSLRCSLVIHPHHVT
jgi:hypothetical protein